MTPNALGQMTPENRGAEAKKESITVDSRDKKLASNEIGNCVYLFMYLRQNSHRYNLGNLSMKDIRKIDEINENGKFM